MAAIELHLSRRFSLVLSDFFFTRFTGWSFGTTPLFHLPSGFTKVKKVERCSDGSIVRRGMNACHCRSSGRYLVVLYDRPYNTQRRMYPGVNPILVDLHSLVMKGGIIASTILKSRQTFYSLSSFPDSRAT